MATLSELFKNIADAIRTKTGGTATIVANDFPTAIAAIDSTVTCNKCSGSGKITCLSCYGSGKMTCTTCYGSGRVGSEWCTVCGGTGKSGTCPACQGSGKITCTTCNGSTQIPHKYQTKTTSPSTSAKTVKPDAGYSGLSQVTVNAISIETKSVTPSASAQTVKPSSGKYLTQVTVNAIPSNYIADGYKVISGEFNCSSEVTSYSISTSGITTLIGFIVCGDSGRSAFLENLINVSKLGLSTTGGSWTQTSWVLNGTSISASDVTISFANNTLTITPSTSKYGFLGAYDYILIGQ